MKRPRSFRGREKGQALVEVSLLGLVLVIMVSGMVAARRAGVA